mmetsp:Transcript_4042/g.3937  ORF Transcript_4042/g.3937 Transcript_4042/m.3937 type:complete len:122 (-) Transcript_4042:1287-1652(-)
MLNSRGVFLVLDINLDLRPPPRSQVLLGREVVLVRVLLGLVVLPLGTIHILRLECPQTKRVALFRVHLVPYLQALVWNVIFLGFFNDGFKFILGDYTFLRWDRLGLGFGLWELHMVLVVAS